MSMKENKIINRLNGRKGKTVKKICKECGNTFLALQIKVRIGQAKFCSRKCYQIYRNKNKQDEKYLARIYQKKHKYGITRKEYEEMIEKSEGKCCICGNVFTDENRYTGSFVDHNHKTGTVRELLCNRCNRVIGYVGENIEILNNMINYLNKHNK